MKAEDLSNAVGKLDEAMISEAAAARRTKKRPKWIGWVAAAACVAVAVAIVRPFGLGEKTPQDELAKTNNGDDCLIAVEEVDYRNSDSLISLASYPKMEPFPSGSDIESSEAWDAYGAQYDVWLESKNAYRSSLVAPDDTDFFDDFYRISAQEFLSGGENENIVYSPTNVYMALAMLAEVTDGNSRQQILDLLGSDSIEALRTEAAYLWGSNYCDDGLLTTVMANSLWLSDSLTYNEDTLKRLAQTYYATTFSGVMGSEAYNAVLQSWLNHQTGNLLEDAVKNLQFDPQTVMALASTIYFKGVWQDKFRDQNTTEDIFHCANGEQTTVDFMHRDEVGLVYWGESYTAIEKGMENGASMWLILPDEGKTVQDVLSEDEIFSMTLDGVEWSQKKSAQIHLSMPKFDVSSKLDLISGLENLGVKDVFDSAASDFTPLSGELTDVLISQVEHAARVTVDEDGCTAAAYTVMIAECAEPFSANEIDFVLDRPFLFVITGCGDQPLFIGVVNQA